MYDGEIFSTGLVFGAVVSTIFWLVIIGFTSDANRQGNFYVSSEKDGWVVRMDNSNGNSTNITKPASLGMATTLADKFNHDIQGYENK